MDDTQPHGPQDQPVDEALVEPEGVNAGNADVAEVDGGDTSVEEEPATSPGPLSA